MKSTVISAVEMGLGAASRALKDLNVDMSLGVISASDTSERRALLATILKTESSSELRRVAAWGLSKFARDPVAAEALANALRRDTSEAVREMSAWALQSARRQSVATASLVSAIRRDNSSIVRLTAVWSLASTGHRSDSATVSALAFALKDSDARIREMAAWALGSISLRTAPSELVAATEDSNNDVRISSAWALYEIGDASAVDALDTALRNEKVKEVQLAQVRALTSLGEPAIAVIKRLLDDPNPEIKTVAVNALAGSRANKAWPRPRPLPRPFP